MKCPKDGLALQTSADGSSHHCRGCHGLFLERKRASKSFYENISSSFKKSFHQPKLTCPGCSYNMLEICHGELVMDICQECRGLWLDEGEADHLEYYIKRRFRRNQYGTGQGSRDSEVKALYKRYHALGGKARDASKMEALFQILTSLPLERNLEPVKTPVLVFALILINTYIYWLSVNQDTASFLKAWGYIPAEKPLFPYAIYSNFLHGSFMHLLGNMYFLWVLGDNVEDLMGRGYFLMVYFASGIVGFIASGVIGPYHVPHIGASCAVAGVMAAYLLLFPKAKFVLRFFIFIVFPVSCFLYLGFWFAMQMLNLFIFKTPGISWAGHIGGFVTGFLLTSYYKRRHRLIDNA